MDIDIGLPLFLSGWNISIMVVKSSVVKTHNRSKKRKEQGGVTGLTEPVK